MRRAGPEGLGWRQEAADRHRQDGFGRENSWARLVDWEGAGSNGGQDEARISDTHD